MQQWVENNLIVKAITGSRAYGTDTPDSDWDYRGVTVPPAAYTLGLMNFEQYESQANDDIVYYGVKKFFKLVLNSNPNILELLFLPKDCIVESTPHWKEVVAHREHFLSKKAIVTYGGYARSQLKKLNLEKNSKEWENTKPAMHLIRLLEAGRELLVDGHISVRSEKVELLREIRAGNMTPNGVLLLAKSYMKTFDEAADKTTLPDEPSFEVAQRLCAEITWDYVYPFTKNKR